MAHISVIPRSPPPFIHWARPVLNLWGGFFCQCVLTLRQVNHSAFHYNMDILRSLVLYIF